MLRTRLLRRAAGLALIAGSFAAALYLPIPTAADAGRGEVLGQLAQRLPGWEVERLDGSWENAFTVVATCAGRRLDFQLVPEHGLAVGDAWLRPSDPYSHQRLDELSDHYRQLIWYRDPALTHTLSCSEELARSDRLDDTID